MPTYNQRSFIENDFDLEKITPEDFVFVLCQNFPEVMPLTKIFRKNCIAAILMGTDGKYAVPPFLDDHTLHRLIPPPSNAKEPSSEVRIVDFRKPRGRGRDIFTISLPTLEECSARLQNLPERKVWPMYDGPFDAKFPEQPVDFQKFIAYATQLPLNLPPEAILSVTEELRKNDNKMSTNFRGGWAWAQDHSQEHLEHQEQLEEQVQQEIQNGWVIGPFTRPPFPNPLCPQQPKVNLIFSVPKNKYDPTNPTRRMIFHFSFPKFMSKNHMTPRNDSGLEYLTVRKIFLRIAQLGRGTKIFMVDVKAAYKLLSILRSEWFSQVFRIGLYYYVCKTGMFGDVAAGDNWDRFMRVLLAILRRLVETEELFCYVDNIVGLTAPRLNDVPDEKLSQKQFKTLLRVLQEILHVPIHDIVSPSLVIDNLLGWGAQKK